MNKSGLYGNVGSDYQPVAYEFAGGKGYERVEQVDAQKAQCHGDDAAYDGHPCQQSGPCAVASHPLLATLQLVGGHFGPAGNPLLAAHRAYAVVEQSAKGVAGGAPYQQFYRIGAGSQQGKQYGLGGKWQKGAGQKGGTKHAYAAVGGQCGDDGIHDGEVCLFGGERAL